MGTQVVHALKTELYVQSGTGYAHQEHTDFRYLKAKHENALPSFFPSCSSAFFLFSKTDRIHHSQF